MLEVATEAAFEYHGYRARTVCRIEREAETAAAGVALAQAAGREAPVHSDLATFDGRPWRGLVDCCVAGLPCPAFSTAGKRTGNSDERAWGTDFDPEIRDTWGPQPHWLRILAEARPPLAILENVPAWVAAGHFRIVGDCLSGLGYTVQDPIFVTADSVGGSHKRERVFVLAYRECDGGRLHETRPGAWRRNADRGDGQELADGRHECEQLLERAHGREPTRSGDEVGDGAGIRRNDNWTEAKANNSETHEGRMLDLGRQPARLPLHCPGRNDWAAWAAVAEVDASRMPAIESGISVVADGLAETGDAPVSNASLLRIGGNGVDSLAAATAIATLLADAGIGDKPRARRGARRRDRRSHEATE